MAKSEATLAKSARVKKAAPKPKKASISLVTPVAPRKKDQERPGNNATVSLGKARKVLELATGDYNFQSQHFGNAKIDFAELYKRLMQFHATFKAKAILKSTRDGNFNWQKFGEEVATFRKDLFEVVIDHMDRKATRMADTVQFTTEELEEMWDEAQKEEHPREQIRGWSNLIHNLKAVGCYDPEDQPRGGRQSGGNRRR